MKIRFTFLMILTIGVTCLAQDRNPFFIGHSLVNHTMPSMVHSLAKDAGIQSKYGVQIINGSPLHNNFDGHATAEGTSYRSVFPGGNFNSLIITEAVPLQNHLTWSDTYGNADKFYKYAKNNNNGIPTKFYIYETWHCINSGILSDNPNFPNGCWYDNTAHSKTLWYERLKLDFPLWSGIVSHVRSQNVGDDQIWMVPAGQALYNLASEINEGKLPGVLSIKELFHDDIHLNHMGNYFVACVMYATIYGKSPEGLTSVLKDEWGNLLANMPSASQALIMQKVAWNTVTKMRAWTGVDEVATSTQDRDGTESFTISPNPSFDFISVIGQKDLLNAKIRFFNSQGNFVKEIFSDTNKPIDISDLPAGLYFAKINNVISMGLKFIKI
jgi:hypothetical protein